MRWKYNDGGRADAGYKGVANDCACRAISIATKLSYQEAYELINSYSARERRKKKSHARTGVHGSTMRSIMDDLDWNWTPTMQVGSGCKVHLHPQELPSGTVIARVSKHFVATIDGIAHDTHDSTRDGTRCVYGFWQEG